MRFVFWLGIGLAICVATLPKLNTLSKSLEWQAFGSFVTTVPTTCPYVALTLDDGPSPQFTHEVLDILRRHDTQATFFLTGHEAARRPELVAAIAAEGHEIGNHSYAHRRMVGMHLLDVQYEIERTEQILKDAGYEGPQAFRPPYGKRLFALPAYLWATGRPAVLWSLDPEYEPQRATRAEEITERVLEAAQPGDILLMHVMYKSRATSRAALPDIITGLRARGLEPVPLARLQNGTCERRDARD